MDGVGLACCGRGSDKRERRLLHRPVLVAHAPMNTVSTTAASQRQQQRAPAQLYAFSRRREGKEAETCVKDMCHVPADHPEVEHVGV